MDKFLSAKSQEKLRQEILESGGNEVFCIGQTDTDQLVVDVEILARASRDAVPAILQTCRPGDVIIPNHPRRHLAPSDPDLATRAKLGSTVAVFYTPHTPARNPYRRVTPPHS